MSAFSYSGAKVLLKSNADRKFVN